MKIKLRNRYAGPKGSYEPGAVLQSGGKFSSDELLDILRAGHADLIRGPATARAVALPPAQTAAVTPEPSAVSAPVEDWRLKTSPREYLARFPDGPRAELARAHINAEA